LSTIELNAAALTDDEWLLLALGGLAPAHAEVDEPADPLEPCDDGPAALYLPVACDAPGPGEGPWEDRRTTIAEAAGDRATGTAPGGGWTDACGIEADSADGAAGVDAGTITDRERALGSSFAPAF